MTITPSFTLTQDVENVYLRIHLPYIRVVNATEILIDGTCISFHCAPYLLELTLPYPVLNEEGRGESQQLEELAVLPEECTTTSDDKEHVQKKTGLVEVIGEENSSELVQDDSNSDHTNGKNNNNATVDSFNLEKGTETPSTSSTTRFASASYDPNDKNGMLTITLPKETPGQLFPDFDLITKLMIDKHRDDNFTKVVPSKNLISEVTEHGSASNNSKAKEKTTCSLNEQFNDSSSSPSELSVVKDETLPSLFKIHENATTTTKQQRQLVRTGYGFRRSYRGVFSAIVQSILKSNDTILEIPFHPDEDDTPWRNMTMTERRQARLDMEHIKFDKERYLGDYDFDWLVEEDMIFQQAVIDTTPHWYTDIPPQSSSPSSCVPQRQCEFDNHSSIEEHISQQFSNMTCADNTDNDDNSNAKNEASNGTTTSNQYFTHEERQTLATLALKRNSGVAAKQTRNNEAITEVRKLLLTIVDLLFAYVLDHRLTGGEPTCESAWTISMISPTLSWLEERR